QYDKHTWLGIICVVAVIGYIISFATGPGAIPWFFTAELFSQGPRSAAVSIGVVVNWAANAIVGITYPFLEKKIKAYSFVPFVVLLAIFWTYTLLKVPETKGRRIEEITAMFQTKRHVRYRQIRRNDSGDETE
ncbi:GTR1-like protein, partial [Mya arenaria]